MITGVFMMMEEEEVMVIMTMLKMIKSSLTLSLSPNFGDIDSGVFNLTTNDDDGCSDGNDILLNMWI